MRNRTIIAASRHTMFISQVEREALPKKIRDNPYATFYKVQNFDKNGVVFFWLAKGYVREDAPEANAPKEIVAWYPNLKMWYGSANTFEKAINGAQSEGWLHAE